MPRAVSAEKRLCGICGRALSIYNKNNFCQSHTTLEVDGYHASVRKQQQNTREMLALVAELHDEEAVVENAPSLKGKRRAIRKNRTAATLLPQYHEATRLVQIASSVLYIPQDRILSLGATSKRAAVARDVLVYLMHIELKMHAEEIRIFFGFAVRSTVVQDLNRMAEAMLSDEDMILATDLVARKYHEFTEEFEKT